jgi:ketosteroid isomerase-like protein
MNIKRMTIRPSLTLISLTLFVLASSLSALERQSSSAAAVVASENDQSGEAVIRDLEQHVETAIVSGDTTFLKSVYTDDFRFSHATGQVSTKAQALEEASKRPYASRKLDELNVQLHGDVAVTYGLVSIIAQSDHSHRAYIVRYVRVYQRSNGHWQMLMQRSVDETSSITY